jgi:hypothetical protein
MEGGERDGGGELAGDPAGGSLGVGEEATTAAQRRADAMGLLPERAMIAAAEERGSRISCVAPEPSIDVPEPSGAIETN